MIDNFRDLIVWFVHTPFGLVFISLLDLGIIFGCIYSIIWWRKHAND